MTILVSLDILLVLHAIDLVAVRGPNMMIMFGFEVSFLMLLYFEWLYCMSMIS